MASDSEKPQHSSDTTEDSSENSRVTDVCIQVHTPDTDGPKKQWIFGDVSPRMLQEYIMLIGMY